MKITFALIAIKIKLMCACKIQCSRSKKKKKNAEKRIASFHLIFFCSFDKSGTTTPFYFVESIHSKCYGVSESPRHQCQIPNKSSANSECEWKNGNSGQKKFTHINTFTGKRREWASKQSTNQPINHQSNKSRKRSRRSTEWMHAVFLYVCHSMAERNNKCFFFSLRPSVCRILSRAIGEWLFKNENNIIMSAYVNALAFVLHAFVSQEKSLLFATNWAARR